MEGVRDMSATTVIKDILDLKDIAQEKSMQTKAGNAQLHGNLEE